MKVMVSAPGKVAIIGEYAVLEGAPALVMAVDRRVRVSLVSDAGSWCSVAAPGLSLESARFRLAPPGPAWEAGDERKFPLATHAITEMLVPEPGRVCTPFHLELDSRALLESIPGGPRKLGLGSSAALTVALCHALGYHVASQHPGVPIPGLARLIEIHSGFQGHRGSGLDVAASLYGGVLEYRRLPDPRARPAGLPDGLEYCFVWSGREAATGRYLARIDEWRHGGDRRYRRAIEPLAEIAQAGVDAARRGDADAFLRSLDEYVDALEALGKASGADILSEPHQRLRDLARRHGVVYKPCGAGGGDIGVGMARDAGALARFRAGLAAEQFQTLSLAGDREGVSTQSGS